MHSSLLPTPTPHRPPRAGRSRSWGRQLALCFLFTISLLHNNALATERRVALVIGNGVYQHAGKLRNPVNDATDVVAKLEALGFEVVKGTDLSSRDMTLKVRDFRDRLKNADVALLFYAGHGLQLKGKNYLVPVDAELLDELDVPRQTIALDSILEEMEGAAPMSLVFLDACRNNPLADRLRSDAVTQGRSLGADRGLARVQGSGTDTMVAFSAAPGEVAADGSGRNSPFTAALLKYIGTPGQEIGVMFKRVVQEVRTETNNKQRPQQLSDMAREFYFAKLDATTKPIPGTSSPTVEPAIDQELMLWRFTQEQNNREAYQAYLKKFPGGRFSSQATLAMTSMPQATSSDKPTGPQRWRRTYGGSGIDEALAVRQVGDGYIVAGRTTSKGVGRSDAWILRLDAGGNILWEKTYGGQHIDVAQDIFPTRDGGFVVAGYTASKGWGQTDAWVFKLSATGQTVWEHAFGGRMQDAAHSVRPAPDDGYVVVGYTQSKGLGLADLWAMKLSPDGNLLWDKVYGGPYMDTGHALDFDDLGNIVIAGETDPQGDGKTQAWLVKLNPNGELLFQKALGLGEAPQGAKAINVAKDGSYILAGFQVSPETSRMGFWASLVDATGRIIWQQRYGGAWTGIANAIQPTRDGGFIAIGKIAEPTGQNEDIWLVKLGPDGQSLWDRKVGGKASEEARAMQITRDDGFVVAGYTASDSAGAEDVAVLKLDADGSYQTP